MNGNEHSDIRNELIEVRKDLRRMFELHKSLFNSVKQLGDIQSDVIAGLKESDKERLELDKKLIKQLGEIGQRVDLVKEVVDSSSKNLEKIKRVVDQNSFILESEMNERTA